VSSDGDRTLHAEDVQLCHQRNPGRRKESRIDNSHEGTWGIWRMACALCRLIWSRPVRTTPKNRGGKRLRRPRSAVCIIVAMPGGTIPNRRPPFNRPGTARAQPMLCTLQSPFLPPPRALPSPRVKWRSHCHPIPLSNSVGGLAANFAAGYTTLLTPALSSVMKPAIA